MGPQGRRLRGVKSASALDTQSATHESLDSAVANGSKATALPPLGPPVSKKTKEPSLPILAYANQIEVVAVTAQQNRRRAMKSASLPALEVKEQNQPSRQRTKSKEQRSSSKNSVCR